jgi:peptide-methionine (R)-S-oxide reductase
VNVVPGVLKQLSRLIFGGTVETGSPAPETFEVVKTDEEWKTELSPEQFQILRQAGTERAFTGAYTDTEDPGLYKCAACGNELFRSETKFHSGSGWPSFFDPIRPGAVVTRSDRAYGMVRTEAVCGRCGGHLGHVFDDGPGPTGLRYCMNSVSLDLEADS